MKLILVSIFLVIPAYSAGYTFDTKYIDTPIDHYSFTTDYTFPLRYLINDTFHDGKGPIFFYAGNEGFIEMFAQNSGFMFDIAPKFNALLVYAEHRYYGESLPFGNLSYTSPEYFGYLSAVQAIGDFVYLINDLQEKYSTSEVDRIPAVAFGGSYGGMLAAWHKMKFPNSLIGAVASSAPIWMFKGQNPCNKFYEIVTDDFANLGGENCAKNVNASWAIIRSFTETESGKLELSKLWNLCSVLETKEDIDILLAWLTEIYPALAEMNYPYDTNFDIPLPGNLVPKFCSKINFDYDDNVSLLRDIIEGVQLFTNYTGTVECHNIKSTTEQLGNEAWGFQSCTEIIMPICSKDSDMFENIEWDFESFSDGCYEKYGVRPLDEEVPLLQFGDKDLSTANNIVFVNGLVDPWSGYGVLQNFSSNMLAVVIPDGAHHYDLRASEENDTDNVKIARQIIINQISKWIDDYYSKYLNY